MENNPNNMNNMNGPKGSSQPQGSNGIAITGFVFSLLSIVLLIVPVLNILLALVGLILSIIGMNKAKNLPDKKNHGLALAGVIISAIFIVLGILSTIGAVAYFGVLSPQDLTPQLSDLAEFGPPITNDGIPSLNTNDGKISVALRNGVGGSITADPTSIDVNVERGTCTNPLGTIDESSANQTISPGSNFVLDIYCENLPNDGELFKGTVIFTYTGTNGVDYNHQGTVQGTWK